MTAAVTNLDDVTRVAEQVRVGLDRLLHAEYWKLPGYDIARCGHLAHRHPPRHHPARPRLRLPRLRPPRPLVRPAPHPVLGRRLMVTAPPSSSRVPFSADTTTPLIHTGHWHIRMAPDGHPEIIRPPGLTPTNNPAATPCTDSANDESGRRDSLPRCPRPVPGRPAVTCRLSRRLAVVRAARYPSPIGCTSS